MFNILVLALAMILPTQRVVGNDLGRSPCVCGTKCQCSTCKCKKTGAIVPVKKVQKCECKPCKCNQGIAGGCKCDGFKTTVHPTIISVMNPNARPPLSRRLWVQDVKVPGRWYFGWYASDGRFHYTHSYTKALSNFSSLVPYSRSYDRSPSAATWPVVYDP